MHSTNAKTQREREHTLFEKLQVVQCVCICVCVVVGRGVGGEAGGGRGEGRLKSSRQEKSQCRHKIQFFKWAED